jgi:hypothetical protein
VNEFVSECRREWKRLGVPRSTIDEMAAELDRDLDEGTPEEVLGTDAANAPAFARTWAEARGVIRERQRSRVPAILTALALIPTVVGAALMVSDDTSGSTSTVTVQSLTFAPSPKMQTIPSPETILAYAAHNRAVAAQESARLEEQNEDANSIGTVLLIAGLAVLLPSTLFSSGRVALGR